MNRSAIQIDESLENWNDVKKDIHFTGILVGNGASRNIWQGFAYDSLYDIATSVNQGNPRLNKKDQALFDSQGTRNFEMILVSLATARRVLKALGLSHKKIDERYNSIQKALVAAVKSRHIPWIKVPDDVFVKIKKALRMYRYVYSTNYDLLAYWAIMLEDGENFKDYFWSDTFDLSNTEIWDDNVTRVVYLHGGLHLCKGPHREIIKRANKGKNLLYLVGSPYKGKEVSPLFVAEGIAKDKLRTIHGSDYLAFAYSQLKAQDGPLCIFGHSLCDADKHIAEAVKGSSVREIAISIKPTISKAKVISRKAHFIGLFPKPKILRFFNSCTHPLGAPELRVTPSAK